MQQEVLRAVRAGALVAVGAEWTSASNEELVEKLGYLPGSEDRLGTKAPIPNLFGSSIDDVLLQRDTDSSGPDPQSILVVFSTVEGWSACLRPTGSPAPHCSDDRCRLTRFERRSQRYTGCRGGGQGATDRHGGDVRQR